MAIWEMNGIAADVRPTRSSLAHDLHLVWHNFVTRRRERRLLVKLSRLDARQLRDMGFDPAAIYGALEGSWDEVHGDRFRGL